VLSAAIDKYVYITVHETFQPEYLIKYSTTEVVQTIDQIKHPIIREALRLVPVAAPHLEIVSMSDIPAGTGLGSSGSFTIALLRALHTLNKDFVPRQILAEQACHIEIDLLKEPVGKQDQYIAWFRCRFRARRYTTSKTTCCSSSRDLRGRLPRFSRSRT
jgi:D-glycero-alpha-D-manno-heptose-7-phosphate kinase